MTSAVAFVVFFMACLAAASTGIFFRPGRWYASLQRPSWRPPDALFGPVWLVLYVMIATSGWLVWRDAGLAGAALPLAVYTLQLVLNGLWSWLSFGLRRLDLAFFEMGALWLSILATILAFQPISATAAWLLVPYLAWVSFALFLNFTLWRMNPETTATAGR
jgi:tryptophan-rich sensory protein